VGLASSGPRIARPASARPARPSATARLPSMSGERDPARVLGVLDAEPREVRMRLLDEVHQAGIAVAEDAMARCAVDEQADGLELEDGVYDILLADLRVVGL